MAAGELHGSFDGAEEVGGGRDPGGQDLVISVQVPRDGSTVAGLARGFFDSGDEAIGGIFAGGVVSVECAVYILKGHLRREGYMEVKDGQLCVIDRNAGTARENSAQNDGIRGVVTITPLWGYPVWLLRHIRRHPPHLLINIHIRTLKIDNQNIVKGTSSIPCAAGAFGCALVELVSLLNKLARNKSP